MSTRYLYAFPVFVSGVNVTRPPPSATVVVVQVNPPENAFNKSHVPVLLPSLLPKIAPS